jgi:homoserine kinase
VRTQKAREALPGRIPISDAVFNVAHASLLVLGLAKGDLGLIARGLGDRIHQPRRAHLYPRSWELVQQARSLGALGATISGAGPTVLVWCDFESTGAVRARLEEFAQGWAEVHRVPFTPTGAEVRSL